MVSSNISGKCEREEMRMQQHGSGQRKKEGAGSPQKGFGRKESNQFMPWVNVLSTTEKFNVGEFRLMVADKTMNRIQDDETTTTDNKLS